MSEPAPIAKLLPGQVWQCRIQGYSAKTLRYSTTAHDAGKLLANVFYAGDLWASGKLYKPDAVLGPDGQWCYVRALEPSPEHELTLVTLLYGPSA